MAGRESPRESLLPGASRPVDINDIMGGPPSPAVAREAPALMRNPSNSALRGGKASRESEWDEIDQNLAFLVAGSHSDVDFLVERVKRSLVRLRERYGQQATRHSNVMSRLEMERESGMDRRRQLERELADVQMRLQRKDAEIQLQLQEDDNQIAELNAKLEKKEQQFRRQECELKEAHRQCKEVRLQREELDRRLVMTRDEQRLSSERHANQWKEMATKTQMTQEELARRAGELENTKSDSDEYSRRLDQKDAEIQELQSTLDVSLEQVHKLESKKTGLRGQRSSASSLRNSMRDRFQAMRSELETVHEENDKLECRNLTKAQKLEETISVKRRLSDRLARSSKDLDDSSIDHSTQATQRVIKELEDTLVRTRSHTEKFKNQVQIQVMQASENERRSLKKKSADLQRNLDMTSEELLKVQQTCSMAEQEVRADQGSLKSHVEQMRKKIAESELRALEAQTAVVERERRTGELKRRVAQQESRQLVKEKERVPENRASQVSTLQQKLDEALLHGDQLRETIQEFERQDIKAQVAQEALKCEFQRYRSALESSGAIVPEGLSGKLGELTRHAKQVEKELSSQRKDISGLRQPHVPRQTSVPMTNLVTGGSDDSSVNQLVNTLLSQARKELETSGDGDGEKDPLDPNLMSKIKTLENQITTLTSRNDDLEQQIHAKVEPMQVEDDRRSQSASGISGPVAHTTTSGEKGSVLEHTDGILQGARLALSRLNKAEKNYRRLGGKTKPRTSGIGESVAMAPSDFGSTEYSPSVSSRRPYQEHSMIRSATEMMQPAPVDPLKDSFGALAIGSPRAGAVVVLGSPVSSPRPSFVPPVVASPAAPLPVSVQVAIAPAAHIQTLQPAQSVQPLQPGVVRLSSLEMNRQLSSPQLSPRQSLGQPIQSPRSTNRFVTQHNSMLPAGHSMLVGSQAPPPSIRGRR